MQLRARTQYADWRERPRLAARGGGAAGSRARAPAVFIIHDVVARNHRVRRPPLSCLGTACVAMVSEASGAGVGASSAVGSSADAPDARVSCHCGSWRGATEEKCAGRAGREERRSTSISAARVSRHAARVAWLGMRTCVSTMTRRQPPPSSRPLRAAAPQRCGALGLSLRRAGSAQPIAGSGRIDRCQRSHRSLTAVASIADSDRSDR